MKRLWMVLLMLVFGLTLFQTSLTAQTTEEEAPEEALDMEDEGTFETDSYHLDANRDQNEDWESELEWELNEEAEAVEEGEGEDVGGSDEVKGLYS